jgi:hypothetical protein
MRKKKKKKDTKWPKQEGRRFHKLSPIEKDADVFKWQQESAQRHIHVRQVGHKRAIP